MNSCRGSSTKSTTLDSRSFPAPLTNAVHIKQLNLGEVQSCQGLSDWLSAQGMQEHLTWGEGTTKSIKMLWEELEGNETSFDLWRGEDLRIRVVRTVHVLRGKVCTKESREKDIFLYNSIQQFASGKIRERNGLLSEKLSIEELPVQENLHAVGQRAINEEMGRIASSDFMLDTSLGVDSPDGPKPPVYNPEDQYPLKCEDVVFVDHLVEIEESKSFPGLLTMYHLYTLDIICTGLPIDDFNTLEYNKKKDGTFPLKYIHEWRWAEWSRIKVLLFAGSTRKDQISTGRFSEPAALAEWLKTTAEMSNHLSSWGKGKAKSIEDLYQEVEAGKTTLELWSRNDGVSLLVRVIHVLRSKIYGTQPDRENQFLFNTMQQFKDGRLRRRDMLMSTKIQAGERLKNLDTDAREFLFEVAREGVTRILQQIRTQNYQILPGRPLPTRDSETSDPEVLDFGELQIKKIIFSGHSYELEESGSFPGLLTMYHLYTVGAMVHNLPTCDSFTSVEFCESGSFRNLFGWKWMQWSEVMDIYQHRVHSCETRELSLSRGIEDNLNYFQNDINSLKKVLQDNEKDTNELSREDLVQKVENLTNVLKNVADNMEIQKQSGVKLLKNIDDQKSVPIDIVLNFIKKTESNTDNFGARPLPIKRMASTDSPDGTVTWLNGEMIGKENKKKPTAGAILLSTKSVPNIPSMTDSHKLQIESGSAVAEMTGLSHSVSYASPRPLEERNIPHDNEVQS